MLSIDTEMTNIEISKNSLVMAAAFAGWLGGTAVRAAQPLQSASSWTAGLTADSEEDKKKMEKHACKGLNSCKGQGGGSKKQLGKNERKGMGACATHASKPKM